MPTAPDADADESGTRRPDVITLVRVARERDTTAAALLSGIA